MKSFIKYITAIGFIVLSLLFLLDTIYSFAFKIGQPRTKIQNIFHLKNKHYEVAFFGSSRTENHIDCELITELTGKSCINFGISGGTPADMLVLMKLAKRHNITFNKAYMQVDYNFNSSGFSDQFRANLSPFITNREIKNQLISYPQNFSYVYIPFYRFMIFNNTVGFREAIASIFKVKQNTNTDIGFLPKEGVGNEISGSFPSKIKNKNEELNQMKDLYSKSNTAIEFFTAPYCKLVLNRNYINKVQSKIDKLHNYVNIFDNKENYFFNCGHLNSTGAEEFTRILAEDLLK